MGYVRNWAWLHEWAGRFERAADLCTSRPRLVLACAGALALAGGGAIPSVTFDASAERLVVQDRPDAEVLREARRAFGSDDLIVVAQIGDPPVTAAGRLARLRQLATAIDGVRGVTRVWFLGDSRRQGQAPAEAALADPPIGHEHLSSRDGRTAAILVFPEDRSDDPLLRPKLVEAVREILSAYPGPERVVASGSGVVAEDLGSEMQADIARFSVWTVAVLVAILVLVLHSPSAVFLALCVSGVGTLVMIGAMAALGRTISVLTTMTPTLILSIGTTYAVYLIELHRQAAGDIRSRARATMRQAGLPVLLSAATTIMGFFSLATSHIPAIREFAIIGAVGVGVVAAAVLFILPAGFCLLAPAKRTVPRSTGATAVLLHIERAVIAHSGRILLGVLALMTISSFGITRLRVDTTFIGWLSEAHRTRVEFDELTERLGGLVPLLVVLDSGVEGGALEPDFLEKIMELQVHLETLPGIHGSFSAVDLLAEINRAAFPDAAGTRPHRDIPESRGLALMYLRRYEAGGAAPAGDIASLVSDDRRRVAVWVRTDLRGSREADRTIAAIREHLMSRGIRGDVTGTAPLLYASADEIVRGQIRGLALALASIAVTLTVCVRSPRLGLIAIPTNLLPILVLFGMMGLFGVPLNVSTSLIACVCLGVIVDDTVHFVLHYQRALERFGDAEAAIRETFRTVGRAILFTSLSLAAAFLVLTFSSFGPILDLGWLSAVTMISALVADLLLLPILLSRFASTPPFVVPARATTKLPAADVIASR
jgi:predicted RND superfamily exporter protein